MKKVDNPSMAVSMTGSDQRSGERGAALATAILILALLSAIAMTVLSVVHNETRIAGSDMARTNACYASAAGIEKMTSDFSSLFNHTSRPTNQQLTDIAADYPTAVAPEGYTFNQTIAVDSAALTDMGTNPQVTIPSGPFAGLIANLAPYKLQTTATSVRAQCSLERQMNNYLIPLFQFGMFSDKDIELHPGPAFTFNGRIHANGNIYVNGNVTFLAKVTTANEFIYDVMRNGSTRTGASVKMKVGSITVDVNKGSMNNGPNITTATSNPPGQRGYFPGSPDGTINTSWNSTSVAAATSGVPNKFGGQLLTRTTGAAALKLPLQLDGNPTRELIKRMMPNDSQTLGESRYHSKAEIRILIDDENPASVDASRIPVGQGVTLSNFDPIPLPNASIAANGGRALWRVPDAGGTAYSDSSTTCVLQALPASSPTPLQAMTVRGVKATSQAVTLNGTPTRIPAGAGITGRILIQIVDSNGNTRDVTQEILSMGMTQGEPNAIVMLQRPLWAAFTQGMRDASVSGGQNYLTYIQNNTYMGADGEIQINGAKPVLDGSWGYLTDLQDDPSRVRAADPASISLSSFPSDASGKNWSSWNAIVPINVYNVREGHLKSTVAQNAVYERGITNVVELNMRNLARWMDGTYDLNLLAGTNAVSANIGKPDGYIVYVSDRRGDRVRGMVDSSGANINSSNGMADNEDVYGANGILDPGEDVQGRGVLIKDTTELLDYTTELAGTSGADLVSRYKRAILVASWANLIGGAGADARNHKYFRSAVRLFNGEDLQVTGAANKLSPTLGISVSSENMAYIWGNYNTTGINLAPGVGLATLNDPASLSRYTGNQVPASIVCDAFFPLSKTWFDSSSAIYPDDYQKRPADNGLLGITSETAVRAGIIAGNNLSALSGDPDADNAADSRLSGGLHNFPRFQEDWLAANRRWNFVGSFVPLYYSTQALGPWWYVQTSGDSQYGAPQRNWAFDSTFLQADKLPPGTPMFQYIEPTAFRQVLY